MVASVRHLPVHRAILVAALILVAAGSAATTAEAPLPPTLSATGLFAAGSPARVLPGVHAFSPQYPLWSDGARKRRWFALPAGKAIDARNADAWEFPPGTRLWKEFAYGAAVETRYIERLADGRWRYATYLWNAERTEAVLAPEFGTTVAVADAPAGRYAVPSRSDCRACHDGAATPVLGLSALQLSPDRDALAPHAEPAADHHVDLSALIERGLLVNAPPAWPTHPPRIRARTPTERAVLGYLHGNCAHCHNRTSGSDAAVPVDLTLAQDVSTADPTPVLRSMLAAPARYRSPAFGDAKRLVVAGNAAASVLPLRMRHRHPLVQMPPLGTVLPDDAALALVEQWIIRELPTLEGTPQ